MAYSFTEKKRIRKNFGKRPSILGTPYLLAIQLDSYRRFLQADTPETSRDDVGLHAAFDSVFPISSYSGNATLEYVSYRLGEPVFDVKECQLRGLTYAAPLRVKVRLVVLDKEASGAKKPVKDVREQEVYLGELPLMTENGTFIINGTERVIVSQLHRSPGVFFERVQAQGYFLGKIIPYRGSWVEFEYDIKNLLYVRIDRKRKFYGSVFLRALGYKTDEQILRAFYRVSKISISDKKLYWNVDEGLTGLKLSHAITGKGGETVVAQGKKITPSLFKEIQKAKIERVEVAVNDLEGAYVVADVVDMSTGEVLIDANSELTATALAKLLESGIGEFDIFFPERDDVGSVISATIRKDAVKAQNEALIEIYRKLRPGDPPTLDTATQLFQGMFFDPRKYDFSRVGRMKFNIKLHGSADSAPADWTANPANANRSPLDRRTLDQHDFRDTIRYLLKLRRFATVPNSGYAVDDIDQLGNRRVRAVGELLENQFRIGLVRMERAIKEKMSVYQEMSTAMPRDLVNATPVMAAIREFFGSSQLSQFMAQTNPLSEITHKRRLSALGPGGLSRERAGFEVRDVHPTHYGRICPIETPEGPNLGLISSLSSFARINEYGFIESPYRKVKNSRVVDYVIVVNAGDSTFKVGDYAEKSEMEKVNADLKERKKKPVEVEPFSFYLSAWEEDRHTIAQANIELDDKGKIAGELVNARKAGNFVLVNRDEVDYVDVSPKQLVSVAASLVPFLEHDDANRALMGANMQRQSVPLLRAQAPIVGTGMEGVTARDSGAVVLARRNGIIDSVDSDPSSC